MRTAQDFWCDAAGLAALHTCRSQAELERDFASELCRLVPDVEFALHLTGDVRDAPPRKVAVGGDCRPHAGAVPGPGATGVPAAQRLPIPYRQHVLGEVVVGRALQPEEQSMLGAALAHFGAALVNLTLNEESRRATENYCARLQALEEGIVLFQEEDPEAVLARLLGLATSMVRATAGALYVLREVGDLASGLQLEQVLGMPEQLLSGFRGTEERKWPDVLLGQPAQFVSRDAHGSLGQLAAECVPSMLESLLIMPLRYHGVDAGMCLLFNPAVEAATSREYVGRIQSLGQLGAALLHRLWLEAESVRNQSLARELEIAAAIQKRLLPTVAPSTDEYEFAWCSVAARHIGGDLIDLLGTDRGALYAVVADASGHGVNSALLVSSLRSTYRANVAHLEPAALTGLLNDATVNEVGPTGMFVTAVLLRLERGTRRMTLCSAGHNPTLVFRARTGDVESIAGNGPPLGFVEAVEYGEFTTHLESGDVVLLYTDGITEAADEQMDMFGEKRLVALLRQHAAAGAEAVLAASLDALREFKGSTNYEDDVSLTVIKAS